jgi:phosphoglycerate dehydrogenase-like enzyme
MHILNTFPIFHDYEELMRRRLPAAFTLEFRSQEDEPAILDALPGVDVLISNRFTCEYAARCDRLLLLHTPGAGLDKVDLAAIPPDVRLCQSFGHGESIAEHVIMVSIALLRRLFRADRLLRDGTWLSPVFNPGAGLLEPLGGKTAVILGTGEIGKSVAAAFKALHVRTVGVNRTGGSRGIAFDETRPIVELLHVLPAGDVLVVAVPLEASTRGLIGARELDAMRPSAFVVNVARGPVVDEEALYTALAAHRLAGAAIDVWYHYPAPGTWVQIPSRFPFRDLENVIMTPHISGVARTTFDNRVEDLLFNIEALAKGGPLRNEVRLKREPA